MRTMPLLLTGLALAGVMALGGCQKTLEAPREDKVCYFIGHPSKDEVKFIVVGRNVQSLEHCAGLIYGVRREMLATGTAGDETEGTYGGMFLFVTNRDARAATNYYGPRFPFLIRTQDNRFVPPGGVKIETKSDDDQQTVEIPKDLPKKP